MSPGTRMLSQADLERLVADGDVDTVIVAFCDMHRLPNNYRAFAYWT